MLDEEEYDGSKDLLSGGSDEPRQTEDEGSGTGSSGEGQRLLLERRRRRDKTHLVIMVLKLAFMRPARMRTLTTYQILMTMLSSLSKARVRRVSFGFGLAPIPQDDGAE